MTDAEELREIAEQPAEERIYKQQLERFRELAATGIRSYPVEVLNRSFFEEQLSGAGQKVDDIRIDDMYTAQHKLIQKFRDNGFAVTEEKPSAIITLDSMSADPMEQRKREFDKLFLETTFIIGW